MKKENSVFLLTKTFSFSSNFFFPRDVSASCLDVCVCVGVNLARGCLTWMFSRTLSRCGWYPDVTLLMNISSLHPFISHPNPPLRASFVLSTHFHHEKKFAVFFLSFFHRVFERQKLFCSFEIMKLFFPATAAYMDDENGIIRAVESHYSITDPWDFLCFTTDRFWLKVYNKAINHASIKDKLWL